MHNINKSILIDYIYKTSDIGKGVIIEGVDILNIYPNGVGQSIPCLYVNVHFNNNGRKNSIFQDLSYHHFIEYTNKIKIDKLNKLKKLCIEGK